MPSYIQGVSFNWSLPKSSKCQSVSKFWHLELFDVIYYVIWYLELFGRDQLKKNTLYVEQPQKYILSLSLVFQVEELCRFLSQPSSAYSGVDYGRTAGHVVYMVLLIKYSTIWFIWCEGINTIWPAGIQLFVIDWTEGLLLIKCAFYSPLFFLKSYCW